MAAASEPRLLDRRGKLNEPFLGTPSELVLAIAMAMAALVLAYLLIGRRRQVPKTIILDGNIYDALAVDSQTRDAVAGLVRRGLVRVIATPVLVRELSQSPFKGVPDWFPVERESEGVAVLGHWPLGMARLGDGQVYNSHRGGSNKIADAIIADSAASLADVLVSNDQRCRKRLAELNTGCVAFTFEEFREWLQSGGPKSGHAV